MDYQHGKLHGAATHHTLTESVFLHGENKSESKPLVAFWRLFGHTQEILRM